MWFVLFLGTLTLKESAELKTFVCQTEFEHCLFIYFVKDVIPIFNFIVAIQFN